MHGAGDAYGARTGRRRLAARAQPGIMVLTLQELFHHSHRVAAKDSVQFKVTVSFLEVYNENIRDLLSDGEEFLDLREDPMKARDEPASREATLVLYPQLGG